MIYELNKAFKDYVYEDEKHEYFYVPTGQKLKSVTQFLNSLKEPFETERLSNKKALERGVPVETILAEWKDAKEIGLSRGTFLHNLIERLNQRNHTWLDERTCCSDHAKLMLSQENALHKLEDSWAFPPLKESFEILRGLAHKFKQETGHIIPITQEFVVGDQSISLAGRFDALVFNDITNNYEVWDYKTDKKLEYVNNYGKKLSVFNVDECEYEKYSLQLSLYKYMIEKNTGLKLGQSTIVHFKWYDRSYEIIPAKDYSELIKEKLDGNNN